MNRQAAIDLGADIKTVLCGMFKASIDHPDSLEVTAELKVYDDTSHVKYNSEYGLDYDVRMEQEDLRRAVRTHQAVETWLVTVQGKSRIPITVRMGPLS